MKKFFNILCLILLTGSITHAQNWLTPDTLDLTTSDFVVSQTPVFGPIWNGSDTIRGYVAYHQNTNNTTGIQTGDSMIVYLTLNNGSIYPHMGITNSLYNIDNFTAFVGIKSVKTMNNAGNIVYVHKSAKTFIMSSKIDTASRLAIAITIPAFASIGGSFDAWHLSPTPGYAQDTLPMVSFPQGSSPTVGDLLAAVPGSGECYASSHRHWSGSIAVIDCIAEPSTELLSADTAHYITQAGTAGAPSSWKRSFVPWCIESVTMGLPLGHSICAGDSYTWRGQSYSSAGTYTDTTYYTSAGGCDSARVHSLYLSILQPSSSSITADICSGQSYAFGSQTLTNAGSYTGTFTNSVGCDSTVSLQLSVLQPSSSSQSHTMCAGDSYSWQGQTITSAGTYTATLTNSVGCDSTITLTVSVLQPSSSSLSQTICAGSSYSFGGQTLTQSGTYTHTLTNSVGCDSVITLSLSVLPTLRDTISQAICAGTSITWQGQTLSQAGYYHDTLSTSSGCDSISTLALTLLQPSSSSQSHSMCAGDSYSWQGQTITSAGTYTTTLTNSVGCDSTITLTVAVLQPSSSSITADICSGQSYQFGSQTLTNAGSYTATFTNSVGCDSIVSLQLSVLQPSSSTVVDSFCDGTSYTLADGQNATSAGTYTATLTNAVGCDSVISYSLSTIDLPTATGIQQNTTDSYTWDFSLTGASGYTSISWDYGDGQSGSGLSVSHTYTSAGGYDITVILTSICGDTTLYLYNIPVSTQIISDDALRIYPNPAREYITIAGDGINIQDIQIFNTMGQMIPVSYDGDRIVFPSHMPPGMYIGHSKQVSFVVNCFQF